MNKDILRPRLSISSVIGGLIAKYGSLIGQIGIRNEQPIIEIESNKLIEKLLLTSSGVDIWMISIKVREPIWGFK